MRTIRALTIAAAIVAALPTLATAQRGTQFTDAWFWGVKVGGLTVADSGQHYRQAPQVGLEWLITRHYGGLYVAGSEAFFHQQAFTFRDPVSADSGLRVIDLHNQRKLDVAMVGFPGDHLRFHPYVGAGFTFQEVVDADAQGPFSNADQVAFADTVIQQHKAAFAPLFMAGVQWREPRFSVFGQATLALLHNDYILANGRSYNFGYEVGLRYNVGTSIDRNP